MTATARATTTGIGAVICGEFNEMQGMRLTLAQVCRMWTLTRSEAEAIVGTLVHRGLLAVDDGGRVCRPQDLSD
jgi:DNA-binding IclR family transcriptional regulator